MLASPFRWSTPAARLDGTIPVPWRVRDADIMRANLASLGYPNEVAYVEHEGAGLWVGLRDNRDAQAHRAALVRLAGQLREGGLLVTVNPGWLYVADPTR